MSRNSEVILKRGEGPCPGHTAEPGSKPRPWLHSSGRGHCITLFTGPSKASEVFFFSFFFPSSSSNALVLWQGSSLGYRYIHIHVRGGDLGRTGPVIQLPLRTLGVLSADPQPQAFRWLGSSCDHVLERTLMSTAGITPKN